MNSTNTGGPAFPINVDSEMTCLGMTLRDYFAAQWLATFTVLSLSDANATADEIAASCYQVADAMLRARGE